MKLRKARYATFKVKNEAGNQPHTKHTHTHTHIYTSRASTASQHIHQTHHDAYTYMICDRTYVAPYARVRRAVTWSSHHVSYCVVSHRVASCRILWCDAMSCRLLCVLSRTCTSHDGSTRGQRQAAKHSTHITHHTHVTETHQNDRQQQGQGQGQGQGQTTHRAPHSRSRTRDITQHQPCRQSPHVCAAWQLHDEISSHTYTTEDNTATATATDRSPVHLFPDIHLPVSPLGMFGDRVPDLVSVSCCPVPSRHVFSCGVTSPRV